MTKLDGVWSWSRGGGQKPSFYFRSLTKAWPHAVDSSWQGVCRFEGAVEAKTVLVSFKFNVTNKASVCAAQRGHLSYYELTSVGTRKETDLRRRARTGKP